MPIHLSWLAATLAAAFIATGPGHERPAFPPETGVCPLDIPRGETKVRRFLVDSAYGVLRDSVGLSASDTAGLRLLTDATDASTCASIAQRLPPDSTLSEAYYQAGGKFLIPTARSRPSRISGFTPMAVLDSSYRVLFVVAM